MRALAVLTLVALAVGCESGATRPSPVRASWRANALGVLDQLRQDVATTQSVGATRVAAARALADLSRVYVLLVAYTDLGGCSHMAATTGGPPRIARAFAPACAELQRASALFSRAESQSDPTALSRATRLAGRAEPDLVAALGAVSGRGR
jgi:hypothetical protein